MHDFILVIGRSIEWNEYVVVLSWSAKVHHFSPIACVPDLESIMRGSKSPQNMFVCLGEGRGDNLLDHTWNVLKNVSLESKLLTL